MKGVKDTKCACRISELRLVLARISIVVVDNIVKSYIHKLEIKKIQFSITNIQVSRCIGRQTLRPTDLDPRSSTRGKVRNKKFSIKGLSKEGCKQYLMGWEDQYLNAWKSAHSGKLVQ